MTTYLSDLFDEAALARRVEEGYVSFQKHPTLRLAILNYTKAAQYERVWDDVTIQCRGLIYDPITSEVIARPFPKFFNYEEVVADPSFRLPTGDPIVSEKMDGSLGIIYNYDGEFAVATRGSFASDQAVWASKFLREQHPDFFQPRGVTTLVEIIYPDNRIVVDYQGVEELALLGAIDNETGADIPWDKIDWIGPAANQFGWSLDEAIEKAKSSEFDSEEGVVLCWPQPDAPSVRLKVKNPRYIELHRIVTNLSTRSVWEALANGTLPNLIEASPDEFHSWIDQVSRDLYAMHDKILLFAQSDLDEARYNATLLSSPDDPRYTRRDLADYIVKHATYPGLCFSLEDGKEISSKIWPMIKPERSLALVLEEDV